MNPVQRRVYEAAFGGDPCPDEEVVAGAESGSPEMRWLSAVINGARGRYARAAAVLGDLVRDTDPVVSSLAASTHAAHRRQLGGHAAARRWDARALARIVAGCGTGAVAPDVTDRCGVSAHAALLDARLGLAADALAMARGREARVLLAGAEAAASQPGTGWRGRVRCGWVRVEVELATGHPSAACAPAERAAELSREHGAARHAVKSDIVLASARMAAARGNTGCLAQAGELADRAVDTAEGYGLLSLLWPAALVAAECRAAGAAGLGDVGCGAADAAGLGDVGCGAADAAGLRHTVLSTLHRVLRQADPEGRECAIASPWVPVAGDVR
ncbi:hypothetical protein SAMN06265360_10422 [Haloechinothrix alba]|uniref:Uncharacterized protein n=1 Tax=Haloechinothrix alba TaxID=664784 RepID=A0A238VT56_9PSEU|nr:hypothetical protein [Haloechinothrix alba]SNR37361.1 hypothetical protein SAMN06265360_10422 [Haloechinothrix alba]